MVMVRLLTADTHYLIYSQTLTLLPPQYPLIPFHIHLMAPRMITFLFLFIVVYIQAQAGENTLSLQWPASTCRLLRNDCDKSRAMMTSAFTIHGLWPLSPANPNNQPFADIDIPLQGGGDNNLQRKLEIMWPSFSKSRPDVQFWRHEWAEHGAYTGMGVKEYFERTIQLFYVIEKRPPLKMLQDAGIILGNGYSLNDLSGIVRTIKDTTMTIYCAEEGPDTFVISEVRFRVDGDGMNIISSSLGAALDYSCPSGDHFTILFPDIISSNIASYFYS